MSKVNSKPANVKIAVGLLFASCGLDALKVVEVIIRKRGHTPVFLVLALPALVWITFKILKGSNWARITALMLFLYDLPFPPSRLTLYGSHHILFFALQGTALTLLFTGDSFKYFASPGSAEPESKAGPQ